MISATQVPTNFTASSFPATITQTIRTGIAEKQDMKMVFHCIVDLLGQWRHQQAAQEIPQKEKELYGVRRDNPKHFGGPGVLTYLAQFPRYNDRLNEILKKHLDTLKTYPQDAVTWYENIENKESSSRKLVLFNGAFTDAWSFSFTMEESKKIAKTCSIPPPQNHFQLHSFFNNLLTNKEAMSHLKTHSYEDYSRLSLSIAVKEIYPAEETPAPDWVLITRYINAPSISDKILSFPCSHYLTWIPKNYVGQDTRSFIVIHQDPLLVGTTLEVCAMHFEKGISSSNLSVIKEEAALLRYKFSHALPFVNGTTEIISMLEKGYFDFHNLTVTHQLTDAFLVMEALTSPLPDFVASYTNTIQLTTKT